MPTDLRDNVRVHPSLLLELLHQAFRCGAGAGLAQVVEVLLQPGHPLLRVRRRRRLRLPLLLQLALALLLHTQRLGHGQHGLQLALRRAGGVHLALHALDATRHDVALPLHLFNVFALRQDELFYFKQYC